MTVFLFPQVILKAQIMFERTVLDYEWPTVSNIHSVVVGSSPPGLSIRYGDEVSYKGYCFEPVSMYEV